jgi:Mrp family chromosome partitioning ATPase
MRGLSALFLAAGLMVKAIEEIGVADLEPAVLENQLVPWTSEASPPQMSEFVQLFHAVDSLNTRHQPYILQFVGSVPGEGVSTVASSFVEIAASQAGNPVLLIDCNPSTGDADNSVSLIDSFLQTGRINEAVQAAPGRLGIGIARLSTAKDARLNINAASLGNLFKLAKKIFPIIVLDCPPASLAPESLALTRFCNCTVLVIEAETTSRKVVAETKQAIERFDGRLIGAVFNRSKNYLPPWLDSWL